MFGFRKKERKKRIPRQNWNAHWSLKLLYGIWKIFFVSFKIAAGAVATVAIIGGICAAVFAGILGDYLQGDIAPLASVDLDGFDLDQNSTVYYVDSEGDITVLQNIHAKNKSEWATYEELPKNLINATVAIEDKRFFEHQGVDWITTLKACARMFFGDASMGGSTITQQTIKNLFDEKDVTVQRKVLEIFRAVEFEKRYDKEVILEWYFNVIYMGERCTGVKTAAATYFGKELENLTIAECASLISITNNPSLYNPYRTNLDAGGLTGAERNKIRQKHVLEEMLDQGMITQEEFDRELAQELVFKNGISEEDKNASCENTECNYRGTVGSYKLEEGVYYCPKCNAVAPIGKNASQEVYTYFVDTLIEDVARALAERDGMEWNDATKDTYKNIIQSGGYHIYSTLDMDVQKQLDTVYQDLSQIPKTRSGQQLQSAMVIVDNSTGDIVALCGGVGTEKVHDGQNRAVDSRLQTGSSIKPLTVYAPAFEAGAVTPATVITDLPHHYNSGSGWPKNDDRKYQYAYTVHDGVRRSVNAVAVNTLELIGTGYSYKFGKESFGLNGLMEHYKANGQDMSDMDYAPLAMGAQTLGVSVRDMTSAFATFANKGVWREGRTFTKVYDREGNLVLDNTQESRQILSEKTVNYMNYCLGDAVTQGTGGNAQISGQIVYGKTGTTASNRDRWFCGFTKYYTAAVWCGYDDPEVINLVNGGNPAAQLFSKVLKPLHNGLKRESMVDTTGMITVTVCLDSGKLATDACKTDIRTKGDFTRTAQALVYKEDAPNKVCDKHVAVEICPETGHVANEYCKLFAAAQEKELEKKSLVKMTKDNIDKLVKAKNQGLNAEYLRDDYVYLVTSDGKDGKYTGISGKINKDITAPYMVCTEHTEESWKEYQTQNPVVPDDTEDET